MSIKWIHLSDFHTGKDEYGQSQLFESIIELIKEQKDLDFIFITGDIANKGLQSEYQLFCEKFLEPLYSLLGTTTEIFIVPGNHDIDRNQAKAAKTYGITQTILEFLDPTEKGLLQRKILFPRFENFKQADIHLTSSAAENWLFSEEGAFTYISEKKGAKIGILGINTAWLSEGGKEDRHNLSPGKSIIEDGLKKIKDCRYKIVLGHHPLDWFNDDKMAISSLFGKHNIIYLHGHLHKNSENYTEGAGHRFFTIQSGAAFQAREHEIWVNRLLLCELDEKNNTLRVSPKQWSTSNQEWTLDGSALPEAYHVKGTDEWMLHIDNQTKDTKISPNEVAAQKLPEGWYLVDKDFLKEKSTTLEDDAILRFFDGRAPAWQEALCSKIPKRGLVNDLLKDLNDSRDKHVFRLTLLTGAGGEGKTTVLLQTICELANSDSPWKVLWLNNPEQDIAWPNKFLNQLPRGEFSWLIACDDSDLVAKNIFETVKSFFRTNRNDIQFLLCCRDSDWIASGANEWSWKNYIHYKEIRLRGISNKDAELIVKGWLTFGNKGLGKLNGLNISEAASRLFLASRTEEENYKNEGAFLGAMLRVRIGDDLKAHIKALLIRLKERPAIKGTLLDAFTYIAAMHAEQIFILTKEVLAENLHCKIGALKRNIVGPLGDEAATATGGNHIYTRHRAIAEVAVEILSDTFHVDFDEIFIELAESAYSASLKGVYISDFAQWVFLSSHFLKKENYSLAIRLDQALIKIRPDTRLITHLSKIFRIVNQPEQSASVFRNIESQIRERGFFHEWSIVESELRNLCLSAYLTGMAVSDQIEIKHITNNSAQMSLSGMSLVFSDLFKAYNNQIFLEACGATAQIGSKLNLDPKNATYFERNIKLSSEHGIQKFEIKTAFEKMRQGVVLAWRQKEIEPAKWLLPANELTFKGLASLIGIHDL